LGQDDLEPAIQAVWAAFQRCEVEYEVGSMSTIAWGEDANVFAALQEAFKEAAKCGPTVMVITLSNACPVPKERTDD